MEKPDRYVLPETRALAALGCTDLLATVYLLATHRAAEANPLAAAALSAGGIWGFAAFKFLLLAVPLGLAEWLRSRRPLVARNLLRVVLIAYLALLARAYLPLLVSFK